MCGAALLYLEPGICFTRCLAPATFSPAVANKEPTQNTKQLLADAISGIKERWLHPFISPTSWENILSQFEDCSRTLNKDSLILNVRFPLLMSNIF